MVNGEENEILVASVKCKLFAWDALIDGWKERGMGLLKISKIAKDKHRLGTCHLLYPSSIPILILSLSLSLSKIQ